MNRNTFPLLFSIAVAVAALQVGSYNEDSGTIMLLDGNTTADERMAAQDKAYPVDEAAYMPISPNVEARAEVILDADAVRKPEHWQAVLYSNNAPPRSIPVVVTSAVNREASTPAAPDLNGQGAADTRIFDVASTADESRRGSPNGPYNSAASSR